MINKIDGLSRNFLIYLILFIILTSYLFGFYLGENSSGGAKPDFGIHLKTLFFFRENFLDSLNNYSKFNNTHSPLFIIFLNHLNFNDNVFQLRGSYALICILLPFFFYKCLKIKYSKVENILLIYLSLFFFLSPYFRSLAYWPGDENLSLIFFVISIFYYLKFQKSDNEKYKNIFLNILFLALASYIRPIYSLFSLFFFYSMIIKNFNSKKFYLSVLTNLILASPAVFYIFIKKNYFFLTHINENINFITSIGFSFTMIFFYLIPFILFQIKTIKFSFKNLIISLLLLSVFFYFFKYDQNSGGGIFFNISNVFFDNNYLYFLILFLSIFILNSRIYLSNKENILLIITIFFLEADSYFYQETFDPLLMILFFLLFNFKVVDMFIKNLSFKKISILFFYLSIFLTISIIKNHNILNFNA